MIQDFTKGRIDRHILTLGSFIALSTITQTVYFLTDLYFVGRLGKEALAGVAVSGNLMMFVLALTQALGVGPTSLIAQALGRKDRQQAELIFNQAMVLSSLTGFAVGLIIFLLRGVYSRRLAADATTATLAVQFLNWFVPAMFLQFPLIAMSAALRGQGDVKAPTAIQISAIVLNMVLSPLLIFGWGTGWPLGVAGTGLASFTAIGAGCLALAVYFRRESSPLRFRIRYWKPQLRLWSKMLAIGLPAGGEFALMSVFMVLVYDIIRPFGSAAQAGFGIGVRVTQCLLMPAVAVAFAATTVSGQNFGAQLGSRVRLTFYSAAGMNIAVMLALTLPCQFGPEFLMRLFTSEDKVISYGSEYLNIISWNFVPTGIVLVSSSLFQGMGNTLPALASAAQRVILFAVPAYLLSYRGNFEMRHVWYVAVAAMLAQLFLSVWLLHREFARKLIQSEAEPVAGRVATG